jgi:hypothetical protein
LVATNPTVFGNGAFLGAPGPERILSPIQQNATIRTFLIEPLQNATLAPNRVRDTSTNTCTAGGNSTSNCPLGTLDIRRRFQNTTGATISVLRFRVVDITGGPAAAGTADLRVLSGATITLSPPTSIGVTNVQPTTLEQPPAQAIGGGLNSTVTVSIPGGIANGATIDVHFLLGVAQGGNFRFFINIEAVE